MTAHFNVCNLRDPVSASHQRKHINKCRTNSIGAVHCPTLRNIPVLQFQLVRRNHTRHPHDASNHNTRLLECHHRPRRALDLAVERRSALALPHSRTVLRAADSPCLRFTCHHIIESCVYRPPIEGNVHASLKDNSMRCDVAASPATSTKVHYIACQSQPC